MTRRAVRLLVGVATALAVLVGPGVAVAGAQDEPPPSIGGAVPLQGPRIVVEPNSGQAPTYEGQRGTTSQFVVLGALLAGLATITTLVARESRRKRRAQPRASTRNEPVAETSENVPDSSARQ